MRFLTSRKLLGGLAALGLATGCYLAQAQVGVVPQVGVTTGYVPKVTYSSGWLGLVPAAATTDLVCIQGSSSRVVELQSIKMSGSAGTTLSLPLTIFRRVVLNTAGTPATTTANPANNISKRDVNDPTATATLISWTANPTINDASPTLIDSVQLAVSLTTMATVSIPAVFDWSNDPVNLRKPPTIAAGATATEFCANLNATSLSSGVITGSITWTER
jgi:hypothetical protein